jgi:F0F1-type ATP synthase alpha subunit
MKLDPNTWFDQARIRVDAVELHPEFDEIGRVQSVGDGIAVIAGLPHARLNELLRFDKGQFGIAQILDRDAISCVLLDEGEDVEAGDIVRGTGEVVRVPVGPELLGRVVDPLGRPLDAGPAIARSAQAPIEQPAPDIIERDAVGIRLVLGWCCSRRNKVSPAHFQIACSKQPAHFWLTQMCSSSAPEAACWLTNSGSRSFGDRNGVRRQRHYRRR